MKTYLAGGAVRDELLGLPHEDQDFIALGADENELLGRGFRKVGKDHDVYLHPQTQEEYVLASSEVSNALENELKRRDLTINAMAKDLETGKIIDPFCGQADLKNKILRHTSESFASDPVRILRLARFLARFEVFAVAKETEVFCRQLCQYKDLFKEVPGERLFQEIKKTLLLPNPLPFFEALLEWGALDLFFPELAKLKGVPQNEKYHPEGDCWTHTMLALKNGCSLSNDLSVRFACLVHDLGKGETPESEWPRHIMHERRSAKLARQVCKRFKTDAFTEKLCVAVGENHLKVHKAFELRPATLLNLLQFLNALREGDLFEKALICCEADNMGKLRESYPQRSYLQEIAQKVKDADISDLLEKYEGAILGAKIRERRIAVIKQMAKKETAK